ncbi:hypothetical protein [Crocosphaera sp. Alani8]|uniref:hypothetical protein n=1 Tax=Crocosphaera sp. Alani8 TaxID=3038952 RepID=UPI00313B7A22
MSTDTLSSSEINLSEININKKEFVISAQTTLRSMQLPHPPLEYVCRERIPRDRRSRLWLEFGTGTGTTAGIMSPS